MNEYVYPQLSFFSPLPFVSIITFLNQVECLFAIACKPITLEARAGPQK